MYYGENYYPRGKIIPDVFKEGARIMVKKDPLPPKPDCFKNIHPEMNDPTVRKARIRRIPMPMIEGDPDNGPLYCTEDWYYKEKKKKQQNVSKRIKDDRLDILETQIRIKQIKRKLATLDASKKKNFKKIYDLNLELKDLECEIQCIAKMSGQSVDQLEEGPALLRAFNWLKRQFRQIKKKISKWVDNHEDITIAMITLGLPLLLCGVFKSFNNPSPAN